MTLDEAITHCSEVIGEKYLEGHVRCASNHEQLKKWLEELKELKNPQPYKFEENRFFPLIKAMEYQGKAGDEK